MMELTIVARFYPNGRYYISVRNMSSNEILRSCAFHTAFVLIEQLAISFRQIRRTAVHMYIGLCSLPTFS